MSIDWKKLIIALSLPFAAGFIGQIATGPAIDTWYATINKPFFNPPNWIFGPVWTLLYFLMGVSLYLIFVDKTKKEKKKKAIYLFLTQLGLNSLWSILFFGTQNPLLAFLEIVILWIVILLTIVEFKKINKVAAYLLVPYILWVSFASLLNLAILLLN